jgi:hypothetical protein
VALAVLFRLAMHPPDAGRLFHAIVLMGVSLTGAIASCGGATASDNGSGKDAAAEGSYDGISCGSYCGIVGSGPDGYSQISSYHPDSQADTIDSATDVSRPDSDAAPPLDAPADDGCYPCIAPQGDA